jgi:predicted phosphohydrolase
MKNLVWTTDIHLNFLNDQQIKKFCHEILDYEPTSGVVITGDISEALDLDMHLRIMEVNLGKDVPVYFVCGNHDYYRGSIDLTRTMLKNRYNEPSQMKWLPNYDYISLSETVGLVGHDGWYDGRYCDYFLSSLDMNDYHLIKELTGGYWHRTDQYIVIGELAKEGALHVRKGLLKAFENKEHVYVATHVAPFIEASRAPNGTISDKDWLPHFSSKLMGDMLLDVAATYPNKQITVLCGHNHTFHDYWVTKNMRCISGGAKYKFPAVCGVFQI